jgi:hypothetical protein
MKRLSLSIVAALLALPGIAGADKVCIPKAFGVPDSSGATAAPDWTAAAPNTNPAAHWKSPQDAR